MKNYSFIDPEKEYSVNELWNRLADIGTILEDHTECAEKLRLMTGSVFRSEEEREKHKTIINGYRENKEKIKQQLNEMPQEKREGLKNSFKQIVDIANIQRAAHRDKSIAMSLLNGFVSFGIKRAKIKAADGSKGRLPEEAKEIILSSHLFIESAINIYNNLLASLAVTKTELERQESITRDGVPDSRFVWHHDGQRISFPYAVAILMVDLDILKHAPAINKAMGMLSAIIPDTETTSREEFLKAAEKIQKSRDKIFADIKSIYGNYSRNEIERQGDRLAQTVIFKYLGLGLPDEDTVVLAMEGEYEAAIRLAAYKSGVKAIPAEVINMKYGYDKNDDSDADDMEL